jgi:hypothetical protein
MTEAMARLELVSSHYNAVVGVDTAAAGCKMEALDRAN